jgi:hypothetical protein
MCTASDISEEEKTFMHVLMVKPDERGILEDLRVKGKQS